MRGRGRAEGWDWGGMRGRGGGMGNRMEMGWEAKEGAEGWDGERAQKWEGGLKRRMGQLGAVQGRRDAEKEKDGEGQRDARRAED